LNSGLASGDSGLQVNLEIALSGVSAKVKPSNRPFSPAESALRRRMTQPKVLYMIRSIVSNLFPFTPSFSAVHTNALIHVYDEPGIVIETHEYTGEFKEAS